jgi:hypothetical protein
VGTKAFDLEWLKLMGDTVPLVSGEITITPQEPHYNFRILAWLKDTSDFERFGSGSKQFEFSCLLTNGPEIGGSARLIQRGAELVVFDGRGPLRNFEQIDLEER